MHLGGWGLHHKLFVKPFGQKVLSLPKGILEFSKKDFQHRVAHFWNPLEQFFIA